MHFAHGIFLIPQFLGNNNYAYSFRKLVAVMYYACYIAYSKLPVAVVTDGVFIAGDGDRKSVV